jgi:hypothetical protein
VGHPLATEQREENLERFLETADAVVEGVAECVELRLVPPAADPQDEPATAHLVERRRHLRQQGRIAERHREHERPDLDPLRDRGDGGEHGPALVNTPAGLVRLVLRAKDEVVGAPHRVEPRLISGDRHGAQRLEGRRLTKDVVVPERQHQSRLHRRILVP